MEDMMIAALEQATQYKEKLARYEAIFATLEPVLNKLTTEHYLKLLNAWNFEMGDPLTNADLNTIILAGQEFAVESKNDFSQIPQ
jgi:hypothetical protein